MWNTLSRWRYALLSVFAVLLVAAYGWNYNEWRQKKIWIHLDSMTQEPSGVIRESGIQVYPDPKRWFYAPARTIFEGYLRIRDVAIPTMKPGGTIRILAPREQTEPVVGFFS